MPNVTAINANAKPIAVLGLGLIQPGKSKSGYIEEAQYAPHAPTYRARGANVGLFLQEVGQAVPDNTQKCTTTATQLAGKKLIVADSTDGTFVLTLLAASGVASGTRVTFVNPAGANHATLTRASSDHIGSGSATTYALNANSIVVLESNGTDRWSIVG